MRLTRALGSFFTCAALASSVAAQQKVALSKPLAETEESFTRIGAIRELPNGKVLVVDAQDRVLQLVDLAAGTMTKVGREGSGPGEYSLPGALLALPDGSTLLMDMLNRRLLTISPDGKPGAFVELPRPPQSGGGGPMMTIGGMDSRGTDSKGWIYMQGVSFPRPGETASPDSAPILKWDRVSPKFDTVGFVKVPANQVVRGGGGGGRVAVSFGGQKVFAPAETWAVSADGRIARITPNPYRVVWMDGPGKQTAGPVQQYTPIKVTEAEKERWREARRRTPGMMISMGPSGRTVSQAPVGQGPDPEFEETMPPFGAGGPGSGSSVFVSPDGEVWVLRTRPASDKIPSYDVFDRTGALSRKVTLNPNSRVVGFGKGTVYVARSDEDDLQYLQRYARP